MQKIKAKSMVDTYGNSSDEQKIAPTIIGDKNH